MKLSNSRMMNIAKLELLLLLSFAISACAAVPALNNSTNSWKEEVLLHDGTTVIVSRSATRGGQHEPFQRPSFYSQDLSFVIPATKEKVTWQDNFSAELGSANFLPMMLEIDQEIAYLVVNPLGCLSYNKWGRPNPSYIIFKYESKAWNRISLQELPEAFKTPNLIFSSPDDEAKKSGQQIVSAEMIKALYARYSQPQYKTILRDPVKVGCEELVFYKGAWVGPGDSIGKRMMDSRDKKLNKGDNK